MIPSTEVVLRRAKRNPRLTAIDGKQLQRRLAAILEADVVGYRRLMRANEVAILTTLMEHHGRIVKLTGDGVLAEFASVVNAVVCATLIEQGMHGRARLGLKRAEEALRLHPKDFKPAQLGATALATLGEHDRVREWLARALSIDPDDNGTRCNVACKVRCWTSRNAPSPCWRCICGR